MGFSIWLEFDESTTRILQQDIDMLSASLGGPPFQPHMTLIGDLDLPLDRVHDLARQFSACVLPPTLRVERLCTSARFFMAVYLTVAVPDVLSDLRRRLAQEVNPGDYALDPPHVSLAYGNHGAAADLALLSTLASRHENSSLGVRRLAIVVSSKNTPVREWHAVSRVEFSE